MKVVILAGGFGTRLAEETDVRPKPMVEIGGMPILWHIMKIYSSYGYNDFVVCLGYKGYVIKEYFANLFLHHSDITIDVKNNKLEDPLKYGFDNNVSTTNTESKNDSKKRKIEEEKKEEEEINTCVRQSVKCVRQKIINK